LKKELDAMRAKEESHAQKMLNLEDTVRSLEKTNKSLKVEIENQQKIIENPQLAQTAVKEEMDTLLKHKNSELEERISVMEEAAKNF
jgi:F0F1-type ATP synthase gamma subunit